MFFGRGLPTIRAKLAWLVIFCVLPGVLGLLLLLFHYYQQERTQLEREMVQTARALASAVDRELAEAMAASQVLATSPFLAANDLAAFHRQAKDVLQTRDGGTIVLSNEAGQQLVNTNRPFGEPLPRKGNPGESRRVFESGRPQVSDLYIGGVLHRPMVSVDVPVRGDGGGVYSLSIGMFPERLARTLRNRPLPEGWIAAIFDADGTIVARTHEPGHFVGKKGTPILVERMRAAAEGLSENDTLEGVPVFGAFTRSAVSNWTVAVGVPKETLFGPLRRSVVLIGIGVVILLTAGLGLAWSFGGAIARSVRALTAPALALGSGATVEVLALPLREADEVARALATASILLRQRTAERDEAREGVHEAQRLFQDVIDASTSIIYLFDREGRCLQVNRAFCALFGRPAADIVGRARDAFLPVDMAEAHRANDLAVLTAGRTMVVEETSPESDGPHTYLSVKFPVHDAQGVAYAVGGISTDITERKRVEAELDRYRHHLEAEVAERTKALEGALAELSDSEERFRSTFEQVAAGIIHTSFKGRFLRFNKRFCEIIGYPAKEVPDLSYQTITHPDDLSASVDAVARLLSGETATANWEKRYIHRTGGIVWVRLTVSIQRDAAGTPQHFITVVEDISERKHAETMLAREAARYQFLLKTASDGIHVVDEEGNLIEASDSFLAKLGYSAEEAASLSIADWDLRHSRTEWKERMPEMMATSSLLETKHRRRDGSLIDVEINCHGVEFEGARYLYASSRDITARKALEEELRRSNSDLERFAHAAAHDLQEPVRTVVSFSQLLARRLGGAMGSDDREYLDFVVAGAKRMSRLVSDLLIYSQVGASQRPLEPVSAAEAVAAARDNLGAQIAERSAEISVGEMPRVMGEPSQLSELFQNLLSNAIKFTPAGTKPKVEIRAERREAYWEFSVSDNGIGIDPGYRDQVFAIFQRLHTSQAYPGTGIGLAVCKRIIERHGGNIWIRSSPAGGTTFVFLLKGADDESRLSGDA
jgi:PAS domain S-box-containing protein